MMGISEDYQKRLFSYAYNILGSIDDANDVIQDVVVDYIESRRSDVRNESAYLIKSVINKSINLKKRSQRVVGPVTGLPDPISTEHADKIINNKEILSYSLLVLLEYLTPKERAVFILKEAFDYSHQEIAELFSISVENSKQLLSRAKKTLKEQGSDFRSTSNSCSDVLDKYVEAIRSGDMQSLKDMLSEHIVARTSGGVTGVVESTVGIDAVALLLINSYDMYLQKFRIQPGTVNNSPALLFYKSHKLLLYKILDIHPDTHKIHSIHVVSAIKKRANNKKK